VILWSRWQNPRIIWQLLKTLAIDLIIPML
jgi:hypothetical protein